MGVLDDEGPTLGPDDEGLREAVPEQLVDAAVTEAVAALGLPGLAEHQAAGLTAVLGLRSR